MTYHFATLYFGRFIRVFLPNIEFEIEAPASVQTCKINEIGMAVVALKLGTIPPSGSMVNVNSSRFCGSGKNTFIVCGSSNSFTSNKKWIRHEVSANDNKISYPSVLASPQKISQTSQPSAHFLFSYSISAENRVSETCIISNHTKVAPIS